MLPKNESDIEKLAERYFVDELGLKPEEVPEAARNLVGMFEVLFRVSERAKMQTL
jgi:hypothetical protein